MSFCVYDNPDTLQREGWEDGRLLWHVQAAAISQRRPAPGAVPPSLRHLLLLPFAPGRVHTGAREALLTPFARRLKAARLAANLTQPQLADKVGTSQNRICHYERGKATPRLHILAALCRALHVSADHILGLAP